MLYESPILKRSPEMKPLMLSLGFIFLSLSVYAQFGLGRDAVFEHLTPRWKNFHPKKPYVLITGQESGLMIQVPEESVSLFDQNLSWVILPNGKKKKLKFEPMGEGLEGFWRASFKLDKGTRPVAGIYKYSIVVKM